MVNNDSNNIFYGLISCIILLLALMIYHTSVTNANNDHILVLTKQLADSNAQLNICLNQPVKEKVVQVTPKCPAQVECQKCQTITKKTEAKPEVKVDVPVVNIDNRTESERLAAYGNCLSSQTLDIFGRDKLPQCLKTAGLI